MADLQLIEKIKKRVPGIAKNWGLYSGMLEERTIPSKTVLVGKGQFNKSIYLVRKGCLRLCFKDKDKDVTMAFFFENRVIGSLHTYRGLNTESKLIIESIEPTDLYVINGENAERLYKENPELKEFLLEYALERLDAYLSLFLSRIRDSPERRYLDLINEHPYIVNRVPQHYIASYLGITPVSLSRIRNRVWKEKKPRKIT